MSGIQPVLERHDQRYGGPAHPNGMMAIQSVVDTTSGGRDDITHSTWGYEAPGGFFPRPYGKFLTMDPLLIGIMSTNYASSNSKVRAPFPSRSVRPQSLGMERIHGYQTIRVVLRARI